MEKFPPKLPLDQIIEPVEKEEVEKAEKPKHKFVKKTPEEKAAFRKRILSGFPDKVETDIPNSEAPLEKAFAALSIQIPKTTHNPVHVGAAFTHHRTKLQPTKKNNIGYLSPPIQPKRTKKSPH